MRCQKHGQILRLTGHIQPTNQWNHFISSSHIHICTPTNGNIYFNPINFPCEKMCICSYRDQYDIGHSTFLSCLFLIFKKKKKIICKIGKKVLFVRF